MFGSDVTFVVQRPVPGCSLRAGMLVYRVALHCKLFHHSCVPTTSKSCFVGSVHSLVSHLIKRYLSISKEITTFYINRLIGLCTLFILLEPSY